MGKEHIYWTYSAAAQSVAAFIALLLAGFALVHSLMESARERDDTLDEIHAALRKKYHRRLAWLAWITGSAIILSLATVFVNGWDFSHKAWLLGVSALVDLAAIVGGLAFVVSIVDPARYERVARSELKARAVQPAVAGNEASVTVFFDEFRHLEGLVRAYLRRRDFSVPSGGTPGMSFSFRQMIEALLANETIEMPFFKELVEINKYRNLVFHGRVDLADATMIERVRQAARRISDLPRDE
jgi:hypothetical protein